jgi:hypothetical protein
VEEIALNKPMLLKIAGLAALTLGVAGMVSATPVLGPEIDAATASSALALLSGAILIVRSRKR